MTIRVEILGEFQLIWIKILYVSTGNAGQFYEGTTRPGNNKIQIPLWQSI